MCSQSAIRTKCFSLETLQKSRFVQDGLIQPTGKDRLDIVIRLNAQQQPQMISNATKRGVSYVDEGEDQSFM